MGPHTIDLYAKARKDLLDCFCGFRHLQTEKSKSWQQICVLTGKNTLLLLSITARARQKLSWVEIEWWPLLQVSYPSLQTIKVR